MFVPEIAGECSSRATAGVCMIETSSSGIAADEAAWKVRKDRRIGQGRCTSQWPQWSEVVGCASRLSGCGGARRGRGRCRCRVMQAEGEQMVTDVQITDRTLV